MGEERLGQWMDWGADYFTFSDTNIEYIWRFLKSMHDRGFLCKGHRSTEWCPRCGTSISQHELTQSGVYQDERTLALRALPLEGRPGESLVIWTTTPWTLPRTSRRCQAGRRVLARNGAKWVAVAELPGRAFVRVAREGPSSPACVTWGPFDAYGQPLEVDHHVILVGRRLARGRDRHRPYRPRRRAGGLRARAPARAAGAHPVDEAGASTTRTDGSTVSPD